MKTLLPVLLTLLAACSTTDRMRDARPTPPPGPDEAKVVVYRTSPFGENAHFPIYTVTDDEVRLHGFTETDCYFEIPCPAGKRLFLTWGEGDAFVEAELEAGKTYFLRAYSKFGLASPRPGLAPVREEEVLEIWPTLRCRELDPGKGAQFEARHQDRMRESYRAYVQGEKPARYLRPQDGAEESVLPAK